MFSFKSILIFFAQFRVPLITIWLKQQRFALIVIFLSHSFAYTINNTEIFKPQLFSSHATCLHTRLTEFLLNQRYLLCRSISILMNALEGEYLCRQVVYCYFCILFTLSLQCCCWLFICLFSFFIPLLLLYFGIFVDHVNESIIFVFEAFVYLFDNTIFNFVTAF